MAWSHTCQYDGDTKGCGACQDERATTDREMALHARVEELTAMLADDPDAGRKCGCRWRKLLHDTPGNEIPEVECMGHQQQRERIAKLEAVVEAAVCSECNSRQPKAFPPCSGAFHAALLPASNPADAKPRMRGDLEGMCPHECYDHEPCPACDRAADGVMPSGHRKGCHLDGVVGIATASCLCAREQFNPADSSGEKCEACGDAGWITIEGARMPCKACLRFLRNDVATPGKQDTAGRRDGESVQDYWARLGQLETGSVLAAPEAPLAVGDAIVASPIGEGTVTEFTERGYPRVNGVAVVWAKRADGLLFDPEKQAPREGG